MATQGRGDDPLRAAWFRSKSTRKRNYLLYRTTPLDEASQAVWSEYFFESGTSIIESDAAITASASVSGGAAAIVLGSGEVSTGGEITANGAAIIPSDAQLTASAEVSADGENIGTTSTIIESDASIQCLVSLSADGEDSAVPAPVVSSGGGYRAIRAKRRQKPKPKPKPPKPVIVEADAAIQCVVSVRPRYARLFIARPALPPVEVAPPESPPPPPPVLRVVTGTTTPIPKRIEQSQPVLMRPEPRTKAEWVDFEEEMALALLIA